MVWELAWSENFSCTHKILVVVWVFNSRCNAAKNLGCPYPSLSLHTSYSDPSHRLSVLESGIITAHDTRSDLVLVDKWINNAQRHSSNWQESQEGLVTRERVSKSPLFLVSVARSCTDNSPLPFFTSRVLISYSLPLSFFSSSVLR